MPDIIFRKLLVKNPLMPGKEEIHVWRLNEPTADSLTLLSEEERLRNERYISENARRSFLRVRSGIRRVASCYTRVPPESFLIACDKHGKPFFRNNGQLHFNLSHSRNLAVAAISATPVGVDVEQRGRCRNFMDIAQRFFNASEAVQIACAGNASEDIFLNLWTAKEAMLKLSGEGLAGGLHTAQVKAVGEGYLRERRVFLRQFSHGDHVGTIASFLPFEVKGWFDL